MTEHNAGQVADSKKASLAKILADTGFDKQMLVGDGWLRGISLDSTLVVHVRWVGPEIEVAIPRLEILAPVLSAIDMDVRLRASEGHKWAFREVPSAISTAIDEGNHLIEFDDATAVPVVNVPNLLALHTALAAAFLATKGIGVPPSIEAFEIAIRSLPRGTEAEHLVVQRVGQGLFRDALLRQWNGRCAITGVDVPELLRASHIKPWAHCSADAERLDPDNGLLLVANWDAAFDQGLVTFEENGTPIWSSRLNAYLRGILGLALGKLPPLNARANQYMTWHRTRVFGILESMPTAW